MLLSSVGEKPRSHKQVSKKRQLGGVRLLEFGAVLVVVFPNNFLSDVIS